MRTITRINILAAVLVLLTGVVSCSEEKSYVFTDLERYGTVKFTGYNINSDALDYAESVARDDWYYNDEYAQQWGDRYTHSYSQPYLRIESYWRDIFNEEAYEWETVWQTDTITEAAYVELPYINELWAGVGSTIKVTFRPQCPQETEARFTFPDNSVKTLTANDSVAVWEFTNFDIVKNLGVNDLLLIRAESEYRIGETQFVNEGYILVNWYHPYLEYNQELGSYVSDGSR